MLEHGHIKTFWCFFSEVLLHDEFVTLLSAMLCIFPLYIWLPVLTEDCCVVNASNGYPKVLCSKSDPLYIQKLQSICSSTLNLLGCPLLNLSLPHTTFISIYVQGWYAWLKLLLGLLFQRIKINLCLSRWGDECKYQRQLGCFNNPHLPIYPSSLSLWIYVYFSSSMPRGSLCSLAQLDGSAAELHF